MECNKTIEDFLKDKIVLRKRTRSEDPFSIIYGEHIIKGPYTKIKFDTIMMRSKIFYLLKTPFVVLPVDYFITVMGDYWIRTNNPIPDIEYKTNLFVEPFSKLSYNVLTKDILPSAKEYILSGRWLDESTNNLILALCHCYILGVGSLTINNIFVLPEKKTFYINNFDATSICKREDSAFYFNRMPNDKLQWLDKVTHCYNEVSNRLYPFDGYEVPVNKTINLLRKYAGTKTNNLTQLILQPTHLVLKSSPLIINPDIISGIEYANKRYKDSNGIYFFGNREYPELSNYYMRPDGSPLFSISNNLFFSSEHAFHFYRFSYQGASEDTLKYAEIIKNVTVANHARQLGNQTTNGKYSIINENISLYKNKAIPDPNWEETKLDIMKAIILHKFSQDDKSKNLLLSTRTRMLYEDSPYDSFWGIGKDGSGSNWLGQILVNVRDAILVSNSDQLPELVKLGKYKHMVWEGLRSKETKTYSNISFDLAKSALQKYICRSMKEKAVLTSIELYRLGELGGSPGVTNMYNRLAIIANEDIGIANLSLVIEVTNIVNSGNRDPARLCSIVQLMAESYKTRIAIYAGYTYASSRGREKAIKMGILVDQEFTDSDKEYIEANKDCDLFLSTDPDNIRPYALIFLKRLYERNYNAFSWVYYYLDEIRDINLLVKRKKFVKGNPKNITGKPDIILWNALSKLMDPEVHDILVEAYYSHTENISFLQNAIIIVLSNTPYTKINIEPTVDMWKKSNTLQRMLNGDYILTVDVFAADTNTYIGRALTKNGETLIDNNKVIPLAEKLHDAKLCEIYLM